MNKKWEEVKLKHLYNLTNGGTPKSDEPTYWEPKEIEWITPEDLSTSGKKVNTVKRKISKRGLANSSATLIKENSVVISTRAPIGNPKLVPFQYSTNQGCKSMSPRQKNNSSPEYLYYFLSANEEKLKNLGRGTTFLELSNFALRNFKILNPSIKEQNYIAKFLDVKTSEIDTLISDKEKLIKLLEEKRQAIITEAVTKGLDPDVKMKDSGVEWIGEIPEHWEKSKLKYCGKSIIGLTYRPNDVVSSTEGKLVLRSNNLQNGKIFTDDIAKNVYVSSEIPEQLKIKKEDILICSRNGSRHLIGKSGYAEEKHEGYSFGAFTTVFRSNQNRFIYYIFLSNLFQSQIGTYLTSTINQLTVTNLNNLQIALPPLSEQKRIVHYLNKYLENSDYVIEKEEQIINKLKEYRQSLIYEAVTGKIDIQEMLKETEQEEVSSS